MIKAEIGSLIFIKDKLEPEKRRPFICIAIFTNKAKVPYNWWMLPITSKNTIGLENLVEVKHPKLSVISFVKINDLQSVKWDDSYEVAKKKFAKKYIVDIKNKICSLLNNTEIE
jgi:hypothetical protein